MALRRFELFSEFKKKTLRILIYRKKNTQQQNDDANSFSNKNSSLKSWDILSFLLIVQIRTISKHHSARFIQDSSNLITISWSEKPYFPPQAFHKFNFVKKQKNYFSHFFNKILSQKNLVIAFEATRLIS